MKCSRYITRYLGKYKSLGTVKLKTLFYVPPPLFHLILNPTPYRHSSGTKAIHDSPPRFKKERRMTRHTFSPS